MPEVEAHQIFIKGLHLCERVLHVAGLPDRDGAD